MLKIWFRVQGIWFMLQGLGFWIQQLWFKGSVFSFKIQGLKSTRRV